MRRFSRTLAIAMSPALCAAGVARADHAPVDQPGPPLSVPASDLAAALQCSTNLTQVERTPVLLVPGTTLAPENYSWNWVRALAAMRWP